MPKLTIGDPNDYMHDVSAEAAGVEEAVDSLLTELKVIVYLDRLEDVQAWIMAVSEHVDEVVKLWGKVEDIPQPDFLDDRDLREWRAEV